MFLLINDEVYELSENAEKCPSQIEVLLGVQLVVISSFF